jgi:hypothetical protein
MVRSLVLLGSCLAFSQVAQAVNACAPNQPMSSTAIHAQVGKPKINAFG